MGNSNAPATIAAFIPEQLQYDSGLHYIGQGAFSRAFRAELKQGDKTTQVCVKKLRDEKDTAAFEKEAETAWKLTQFEDCRSSFVQLLGVCAEKSSLVFELMPGPSLEKFLSSDRMTATVRLAIVWQIAEGMSRLHARGIIHRDLKAANVLLTTQNPTDEDAIQGKRLIKICDVGEAKKVEARYKTQNPGERYIRAPEAWDSAKYNEKVDVYSFGLLVLELLLGVWLRRFGTEDRENIIAGIAPKDCSSELKDRWQQAAECKDLYKLAQDCLVEDENQRPSFEQITLLLVGKRESKLFTESCEWTLPDAAVLFHRPRRVRVLAVGGGSDGYDQGGCSGYVRVGEFVLTAGEMVKIFVGPRGYSSKFGSYMHAYAGNRFQGGCGGGDYGDGGSNGSDGQGNPDNPRRGQGAFPSFNCFTEAKIRAGKGGKGTSENGGGGGGGGVVINESTVRAKDGKRENGKTAGRGGEGFGAGGGGRIMYGEDGEGASGVIYIEF